MLVLCVRVWEVSVLSVLKCGQTSVGVSLFEFMHGVHV